MEFCQQKALVIANPSSNNTRGNSTHGHHQMVTTAHGHHHIIALISHASKVMLKILQARLQQYVNHELPDVQDGFRKGRGTSDQIANIC